MASMLNMYVISLDHGIEVTDFALTAVITKFSVTGVSAENMKSILARTKIVRDDIAYRY